MVDRDEQRIPPRPALSRLVARFLNPLNRVFDSIYHSEYNPFYRSGTLAIGLLFVLLATGFYLLFFYSVSQPYESIVRIQDQVWLGRWMRALHRYATDAALVAVFFHVLQLLAQGKTWGPRTLAWISGCILLGGLCLSAWSGYVMVWDQHAQVIALSGLELLRSFPFLSDEMGQAFSGEQPVPPSFFFMNLFLHVAIPLGMVFGMWIHTARLARTVWFPIKSVFWGSLAVLFMASLLAPAPLPPEADLLRVVGRTPTDWWFGFWIPFIDSLGSSTVVVIGALVCFLGLTIPWWWRPARSSYPPISQVDSETCNGCTQCSRDCPYNAISMVPHPNGKHLLAKISPAHCVSCGICAASCAPFAVGPPGRSGGEQITQVESFLSNLPEESQEHSVVMLVCRHNDSVPSFLQETANQEPNVHCFDLNCCGTLHSDTIEMVLNRAGGVYLVGCAVRNCMNRDGLDLLLSRLYGRRVPFLDRELDRKRIALSSQSELEKPLIIQRLRALQSYLRDRVEPGKPGVLSLQQLTWYFKRSVASAVLVAFVAVFSQYPMGSDPSHALLRVTGRLPAQVKLGCRSLTEEERNELPFHMQRKEICQEKPISYSLKVSIDGNPAFDSNLSPRKGLAELPIKLQEEIELPIGSHDIVVEIEPNDESLPAKSFRSQEQLQTEPGRIYLVQIS